MTINEINKLGKYLNTIICKCNQITTVLININVVFISVDIVSLKYKFIRFKYI